MTSFRHRVLAGRQAIFSHRYAWLFLDRADGVRLNYTFELNQFLSVRDARIYLRSLVDPENPNCPIKMTFITVDEELFRYNNLDPVLPTDELTVLGSAMVYAYPDEEANDPPPSPQLSPQVAFTGIVYPCLILAYMGEAAFLSRHKEDLQRSFFKAIPEPIFWPVFVIATLATVVGSQAIISAAFSIISQCRALGCFPLLKIIHTSSQIHGQIYTHEVNWILMALCLAVVIGFRDSGKIGNAYGLAEIMSSVVEFMQCIVDEAGGCGTNEIQMATPGISLYQDWNQPW